MQFRGAVERRRKARQGRTGVDGSSPGQAKAQPGVWYRHAHQAPASGRFPLTNTIRWRRSDQMAEKRFFPHFLSERAYSRASDRRRIIKEAL
jgi:hypothetical protein